MRLRSPVFDGAISTRSVYRSRELGTHRGTDRPSDSPPVSELDDMSEIEDPSNYQNPQQFKHSNSPVNVSKYLKRNIPGNRNCNKDISNGYLYELSETGKHTKGNNTLRQSSTRKLMGNIDSEIQNTDPNTIIFTLKQALNKSMQKEASYRLEISRLKKALAQLYTDNLELKQSIEQADSRSTKDNQYIITLDSQIRKLKQQLAKSYKLRENSNPSSTMEALKKENKEMRFVIQQLLKEKEQRNENKREESRSKKQAKRVGSVESASSHTRRTQATTRNSAAISTKLNNSKDTFQSNPQDMSKSSWEFIHESNSKPEAKKDIEVSAFEWTMNPKEQSTNHEAEMDRVMTKEELLQLMEDPFFRDAIEDPQNIQLKNRVLDIINEDYSEEMRQQSLTYASDELIKQRMGSKDDFNGDFGQLGNFGPNVSRFQ